MQSLLAELHLGDTVAVQSLMRAMNFTNAVVLIFDESSVISIKRRLGPQAAITIRAGMAAFRAMNSPCKLAFCLIGPVSEDDDPLRAFSMTVGDAEPSRKRPLREGVALSLTTGFEVLL